MPTLYGVAALAVAAVYLVWRAHAEARRQRDGRLRRRVAYMLWVMADGCDDSALRGRASWPPDEDCGYD